MKFGPSFLQLRMRHVLTSMSWLATKTFEENFLVNFQTLKAPEPKKARDAVFTAPSHDCFQSPYLVHTDDQRKSGELLVQEYRGWSLACSTGDAFMFNHSNSQIWKRGPCGVGIFFCGQPSPPLRTQLILSMDQNGHTWDPWNDAFCASSEIRIWHGVDICWLYNCNCRAFGCIFSYCCDLFQ